MELYKKQGIAVVQGSGVFGLNEAENSSDEPKFKHAREMVNKNFPKHFPKRFKRLVHSLIQLCNICRLQMLRHNAALHSYCCDAMLRQLTCCLDCDFPGTTDCWKFILISSMKLLMASTTGWCMRISCPLTKLIQLMTQELRVLRKCSPRMWPGSLCRVIPMVSAVFSALGCP
jgi:hypothetical protein